MATESELAKTLRVRVLADGYADTVEYEPNKFQNFPRMKGEVCYVTPERFKEVNDAATRGIPVLEEVDEHDDSVASGQLDNAGALDDTANAKLTPEELWAEQISALTIEQLAAYINENPQYADQVEAVEREREDGGREEILDMIGKLRDAQGALDDKNK